VDENVFKFSFCTEFLDARAATITIYTVLSLFCGRKFPKKVILYRKLNPEELSASDLWGSLPLAASDLWGSLFLRNPTDDLESLKMYNNNMT